MQKQPFGPLLLGKASLLRHGGGLGAPSPSGCPGQQHRILGLLCKPWIVLEIWSAMFCSDRVPKLFGVCWQFRSRCDYDISHAGESNVCRFQEPTSCNMEFSLHSGCWDWEIVSAVHGGRQASQVGAWQAQRAQPPELRNIP